MARDCVWRLEAILLYLLVLLKSFPDIVVDLFQHVVLQPKGAFPWDLQQYHVSL